MSAKIDQVLLPLSNLVSNASDDSVMPIGKDSSPPDMSPEGPQQHDGRAPSSIASHEISRTPPAGSDEISPPSPTNSVTVSPLPSVHTVMSDMHGGDDDGNCSYSVSQEYDHISAVDDNIYPDKSYKSNPSTLHNPRGSRPSTSYAITSSTTM